MTISATQVTWSSASTLSVTSATEVTSDAIDLSSLTLGQPISFQLSADNAGTPASGDTAVFRLQWTNGDVLANTGDDYDTFEHSEMLVTLDTVAANTPGEDPARRTVLTTISGQKVKVACVCANAATRNVTIAARYAT